MAGVGDKLECVGVFLVVDRLAMADESSSAHLQAELMALFADNYREQGLIGN